MLYSSASIISSTTILLAILIFFLATRFLARYRSSHHPHKNNNNNNNNSHHPTAPTPSGPSSGIGADDWVALAAALGSIIGCLLILISANQALGRHTSYATPAQVESVLLLIWLDQINYLIVMALAKTSTLLLYTRIFHGEQQRRFRLVCWLTMAVVGVTSVLLMVFSVIMCRPVEYFWTRVHVLVVSHDEATARGGKCKDNRPYLYANTVISIVTDMVIVVLPIRQIVGLQMARKKKVTVCALFGLGMIVIVCSIMRATKVEDAANATDPMVNLSGLCVWSLVESAVSVICCCVPASHRLIRDFFVDLFGREQEWEEKKKQQGGIPQASQPDSKPITRTWDDDSEAGDMSAAVDSRW